MRRSLTIDASPVLGHFRRLNECGVPTEELEKALGMTEDQLRVRDARVPFLNNLRMIETGLVRIGPDAALRLGSGASLELMGVCGHLFRNCRNLAEVAYQFIRYQRLLYAVSSFQVTLAGNRLILSHTINDPRFRIYNRLTVELAFSSIASTIRSLTEDELSPLEVRFTYKRPDYVAAYEGIFRAPLLFNQKEDIIVYSRAQAHAPIPRNQVYVKDVLMKHADNLLQALEHGTGLKDEVKRLVMLHLPSGNVDIEMISSELHMSRWTLTRKLKKEGTTFQALLSELRKELSLHYLKNDRLSISEIAFLLGYSETSTFRRAFKDWTGKTPCGYRQEVFS